MKKRKIAFTTRYVLLVGILLLATSLILGLIILNQSRKAMKTLINKDMLDVVCSAAGTLDGDVLGALTEEDVDGPEFNRIADQLTVFSDSVDIEFIYAVKQDGEDRFVFTVDPDPVDPGAFGEEVLVTDALRKAGEGTAAVDDSPASDRWGNFYSAYCPVFDSEGEIAGIVGIDFNAEWFEQQIQEHMFSIVLFTILAVVVGSILVFLITHRVRVRFKELNKEFSDLSQNIDLLMAEVSAYSGFETEQISRNEPEEKDGTTDELELLTEKIHAMQTDMSSYLALLHAKAYMDSLTRVGNTTAYHEKIHELDRKIAEGTACFTVTVFDLNGLKKLNDTLGHECGDAYILGAATVISRAFGTSNTYRIGGDEFAAILEDADPEKTEACLEALKKELEAFPAENGSSYTEPLSLAAGSASYIPGEDDSWQTVFARADQEMYANKKRHYEES